MLHHPSRLSHCLLTMREFDMNSETHTPLIIVVVVPVMPPRDGARLEFPQFHEVDGEGRCGGAKQRWQTA